MLSAEEEKNLVNSLLNQVSTVCPPISDQNNETSRHEGFDFCHGFTVESNVADQDPFLPFLKFQIQS